MSLAYYSENDPFAAAWLQQLIAAGHIAPGVVDTRSIEDVTPNDLRGFSQCHFFAGIGVWSYALRQAGWADDRPVWTGSCPCQPFSAAGKGGGFADERHLWPAFLHLIRSVRPERVFGEQVASKDGLAWLDLVQSDVEAEGYAFGAVDLCAAGVGSPHIRQRSFWVADAKNERGREQPRVLHGTAGAGEREMAGQGDGDAARSDRAACGLDHHHHEGPQGHARHVGAASGRQEPGRSVAASGVFGGLEHDPSDGREQRRPEPSGRGATGGCGVERLADSNGRDACPKRQQSGREQRFESCDRGGSAELRTPTNGYWRSADWLGCRDGKWRPVEPSHVEMVDGVARNVGYCREQNSSDSESPEKIDDSSMPALSPSASAETLSVRSFGGSGMLSETEILRPRLHGGRVRRDDQKYDRSEQPASVSESTTPRLREMRTEGASCAPSGREPAKQFAEQFADIVRLVPSSLARADAAGDQGTVDYLRALRKAIISEGALPYPSYPLQTIWESLGKETQNRIAMDFNNSSIVIKRPFPLATGETNRVGRLRGYGNAIVAPVAETFIRAVMDVLDD